ncbi:MAG: patatin-like phospholipase family protein [Chitinophagales bacterium]
MRAWLKDFYFSFPIQLFLLNFQRNQLLLLFWALIFAVLVGQLGISYGIPYLLLDPEYLGNTGYFSFALTGMGFGTFFVTWNLNCYILHSHRFSFMPSFQKPMGVFFINNAIIPFLFIATYLTAASRFQLQDQYASRWHVMLELLGFIAGFVVMLLTTAVYFTFTNKTALVIKEERERRKKTWLTRWFNYNEKIISDLPLRVDYFVSHKLTVRHTRAVDHYDDDLLLTIYRQHHRNTLMAQLVLFLFIVFIGFVMEKPYFQLPTAASAFMFLSVLMSLFGVLIYWTGGWGTVAIFAFLIGINEISQHDFLGYKNQVYGLDYNTKPAVYSKEEFKKIATPENISRDVQHFNTILENWRRKNITTTVNGNKPKLLFLNLSGGGLRAAMFSTAVLQEADRKLEGKLFDKTFMISGASGGMFGGMVMRDLFWEKKKGSIINLQDSIYAQQVGYDLLNPMCVSMLSNDLFVPVHQFRLDTFRYWKDRGYMMELKLAENTGNVSNHRIRDYYEAERKARIPLMIFHTEVMNDARRFYISSQPVSFLMRPVGRYTTNKDFEIDAVDFCRFFKEQRGDNLKIISAARMNASFPLMFPNPVLPSSPPTYVLDGGALDNMGYETTCRFLQTFKDWINENTSGVVIVQVRDGARDEAIDSMDRQSLFTKFTNPLGTIFGNMMTFENFLIDQKLAYINEALHGRIQVISFEYIPEKSDEKAALSLHLTEREKRSVLSAVHRQNNRDAFELLRQAMQ